MHQSRADTVERLLQSQRSGFYFGVAEEGEVEAGDAIELLSKDADGWTGYFEHQLAGLDP